MGESIQIAIKMISLVTAWAIAQTTSPNSLVELSFDQMFSLGLLVVVLIVLFKEYKFTKKQIVDGNKEITHLLEKHIETTSRFSSELDKLTDTVKSINKKTKP